MELLKPLLDKIRFDKEPAMWIAVIFVVVLTGYKVFGPEKMPLSEVFSEEYATYVGALAAGVVTRLKVFAPANVGKE